MRLCFRAFDAMKLMASGAPPIAQMSGAVSKDRRPSRLRTSAWAGTVVALYWRGRRASMARSESIVVQKFRKRNQATYKSSNRPCWTPCWTFRPCKESAKCAGWRAPPDWSRRRSASWTSRSAQF